MRDFLVVLRLEEQLRIRQRRDPSNSRFPLGRGSGREPARDGRAGGLRDAALLRRFNIRFDDPASRTRSVYGRNIDAGLRRHPLRQRRGKDPAVGFCWLSPTLPLREGRSAQRFGEGSCCASRSPPTKIAARFWLPLKGGAGSRLGWCRLCFGLFRFLADRMFDRFHGRWNVDGRRWRDGGARVLIFTKQHSDGLVHLHTFDAFWHQNLADAALIHRLEFHRRLVGLDLGEDVAGMDFVAFLHQPLGELALLHRGRQRWHKNVGRHQLGSSCASSLACSSQCLPSNSVVITDLNSSAFRQRKFTL